MILLDTHMWIWFHLEPERLPEKLLTAFEEEGSSFGISSISLWEALTAMDKGRIVTTTGPEITLRSWMAESPFAIIPVDEEIAIRSRTLPFEHEDPADRFIAATAHVLKCPLATADERLRRLKWLNLFC